MRVLLMLLFICSCSPKHRETYPLVKEVYLNGKTDTVFYVLEDTEQIRLIGHDLYIGDFIANDSIKRIKILLIDSI